VVQFARKDTEGYRKACTGLLDAAEKGKPHEAVVGPCVLGTLSDGDRDRLLRWVRRAETDVDRRKQYRSLWWVGAAYFRAGKNAEALQWLTAATRFDADQYWGNGRAPQAWLFLALLHRKEGRAAEEKKALEQMNKEVPQRFVSETERLVFALLGTEAGTAKQP
jgi:hypothetical protein